MYPSESCGGKNAVPSNDGSVHFGRTTKGEIWNHNHVFST